MVINDVMFCVIEIKCPERSERVEHDGMKFFCDFFDLEMDKKKKRERASI